MRSIRNLTGEFLRAFTEICQARAVRIRVIWRGGDDPVLLADESYASGSAARFDMPLQARQLPIRFGLRAAPGCRLDQGAVSRSSAHMSAESPLDGSDTAIEPNRHGPVDGTPILLRGEWRLSIEPGRSACRFEGDVHGFGVIVRVVPSDGALLRGRLERAGALLDLLRAVVESYGPPRLMPRTGEDRGNPPLSPPLIGDSPRIRDLRKAIRTVARSSIPLLIEGESGTGKEVLARNAHNLGPRGNRPLVILNCLEMPRSLMQSELFGHLKGSFTGASRDRVGLIESAAAGTLFLDEIGEMPKSLQAALLRVLQEKEVRRIGESRRRSVDVRFVFATNSDLEALVEQGRFRRDLFYRMCGVRLRIPPLRARRGDIPALAEHFLELAAGERDGGAPHLTARTMNLLMSYDWPGNVRELKHEIERVLALYTGSRYIRPEMLSPRIGSRESAGPPVGRETMQLAVRRLEIGMIEEALVRFDDNRTRAAAHLGITRQGLLKKLKRYGIARRGR